MAHKTVFEYCRGRFTEIYERNQGPGEPDLPIYSKESDEQFVEYIDKVINYSCDGRAADIQALESKKTYIEFLSFLNTHLERVRIALEKNQNT